MEDGEQNFVENHDTYVLDLARMTWQRTSS